MLHKETTLIAKRRSQIFYSEHSRVITRLNVPTPQYRIVNIIERVLKLSEKEVQAVLSDILTDFSDRHKNFRKALEKHFKHVEDHVPSGYKLSRERKLLIGAYFTMEYSVEAAAIFNPSIVFAPGQTGSEEKSNFIMSFRATGEGHISSIEFRSGTLDKNNNIFFDPISQYVEIPDINKDRQYDRYLFQLKLDEMGVSNEVTFEVLQTLFEEFTFADLERAVEDLYSREKKSNERETEAFEMMLWLARSNYDLHFDPDHDLSERVIFPVSEVESKGIEDARFVRFVEDDGSVMYYATYTAYNGFKILPMLIATKDFLRFNIMTLNGKAIQNKGMALFPRKIKGKYVMMSRQDGENNHIMLSNNLHFWQESEIIQEPVMPWEYVQIGNCGSPLETEKGWLLLTHGVGPVRRYCIGIKLLDLEDPSKVIGHIDHPIMVPTHSEREGYVPNVVYSCGALIHQGELILPFAMSDSRSGIASLKMKEIFEKIRYD